MSGEKKGTMDDVDFDKQEQQLLARAEAFRQKHRDSSNKLGVVNEVVDIYSDGVRLSGTLWKRCDLDTSKLHPAILLCHGWGGKRAHLDFSYAPKFAAAGFIALTFDYRTWGDSDGVLLPATKTQLPMKNGEVVQLPIRIVRKVIDPEWQLRDIDSAFHFLRGVTNVDRSRIGLWGSSLGGGHILATSASQKLRNKIAAVVCQIGSIDTHANWVDRHPQYRGAANIEELATLQAQGEVFPWTLQNPIGLDGAPNLPKIVFEHTSNTLSGLHRMIAPTLILAAEKEELFKNENNSLLVYAKLKEQGTPCDLGFLAGGHYDAYNNPAYKTGLDQAIRWFSLYLMTTSSL